MLKRKRPSGRIIQTLNRTWFDIELQIQFKEIRSVRMRIDAQDGMVRISAPYQVSENQVFQFVESNLAWLQQKLGELQPKKKLRYQSGEEVMLWGTPHTLNMSQSLTKKRVFTDNGNIHLCVPNNTSPEENAQLLDALYRRELKQRMPDLLAKWQPVVGKEANDWGIRKMKTRWGTCNITEKRVWLSLILAEKPIECVEFVLVHELVHLHEKHHNQRFYDLMTQFMPDWEERERILLSS